MSAANGYAAQQQQPVNTTLDTALMPAPSPAKSAAVTPSTAATAAALLALRGPAVPAPANSTSSLQTSSSNIRRRVSRETASPAVGREDEATWAAAMARVRKVWPEFSPELEAQITNVRVAVRLTGRTAGQQGT